MNKPKTLVSIFSGLLAAALLLSLGLSVLPTQASAASSSEIRKQINAKKEELAQIKEKIKEVQEEYEENQNEILDIINQKNVIDQEIQLLSEQLLNINDQIKSFNVLIADKQDELDTAEDRFDELNNATKERIRAMEEEGSLTYWEVLFKANSFSDLLDRMSMVEEIAVADRRRLQELSDAASEVDDAQAELESEKADLEGTKQELDDTQLLLDEKRAQADKLVLELLARADELKALEAEFDEQKNQFLDEIAQKEKEYDQAKLAEWEAYMATYVPPTLGQAGTTGSGNGNSSGGSGENTNGSAGGTGGTGGAWLVPCNYTSITSAFGNRTSPTAGASSYHQGVDLDTGTGWTVVASRVGIVSVAGSNRSAGNYVQIDHQDGFRSIYMHLNSYCVSAGQIVSAGQTIGTTGSSGITTGDHLHFGISYNGLYVNPCAYVSLG